MAGTTSGETYTETYGTTSPVTGSAPTLSTDGQDLVGLAAITVVISSAAATTLSGAGTLLCYLYDASIGRWARLPSADFSIVTSGLSGVIDVVFDPVIVETPRAGRIKWVPSAVSFAAGSAGATVTQLGETGNELNIQGRFGG